MYTMIQAGSMGVPYVPTLGYAGSDVIKRRTDDFKTVPNPFDPDEMLVVARAINPDVAVFHALKGDKAGNVLVQKGGEELMLAQASRKVIFTVEEIVDRVNPDDPDGWFIPSIHVTAVVHAPFGAHPMAAPGYYDADNELIQEYIDASDSDEAFEAYLNKYVFEVDGHEGYQERMRLAPARESVAL
ncbi:MAG: hypothetical protein IIC84_02200 [Chloroflexi bacterium]|nr:hypothetical protein [Chloroflexota bacterium]